MCQAQVRPIRAAKQQAWERGAGAVLPFPRGRSESRLKRRQPRTRRREAIGGMVLLGAGLLAAVASGGGPETAMTGGAVLLSAAGVGMMLSGLALIMHADTPDKPCGFRRRLFPVQPASEGKNRISYF
jgi:hypothetical protein